MQAMKIIVLVELFPLLFYAVSIANADDLVRFPGVKENITSPNKQYSISNEDRDIEPNHSLLLKNEMTGQVKNLIDYGRHVDVEWAPNSTAVFVNDYVGSDLVNCLVFTIPNKEIIDTMEILEKFSKEEAIFRSHHLFITCKSWNKDGSLTISLAGYGDTEPNGFEYKYRFDIKERKIRKVRY